MRGSSTGRRWLALALFALATGAVSVGVLGPLGPEVIRYHASSGAINQVAGGDIAGLLLVAPVSVVAGILVLRGHQAGPPLALGPACYALYMYSQLALGGDVLRYPGNSEYFFPLFLGLFVLGGVIAVRAWAATDPASMPAMPRWVDRVIGGYLLAMAGFLTLGLHAPGLVDAWQDESTSTEYLADPVVFWLVKLMDLGIVVPAMAAIAVGILRGRQWAARARYAAVGWAALMGTSVAGMAVVMQATDDPAGTVATTAAFSVFALIAIAIAAVVFTRTSLPH